MQMIKGIDPFIFNDSATGAINTVPMTIDLTDYFYPSTGLMYSITGLDSSESKLVDAMLEENMLTVQLKSAAKYQNTKFNVKATGDIGDDTIMDVPVRRNRAPKNALTAAAAPDVVAVWVGTQKDEIVPAVKVNVNVTPPLAAADIAGKIPISIGIIRDDSTGVSRHFFHDDVDNKLTFVSDLSAGAAARLMVTDGEMKVTLLGKKTTFYAVPGAASQSQNGITVQLMARDDGGLVSDDEDDVLMVHIDAAPTTKRPIGTKVITLGTTLMDKVAVPMVSSYFDDDRHLVTQVIDANAAATAVDLTYFVWSDKPNVATVSINPTNKSDEEFAFAPAGTADAPEAAAGGFYVEGKGRGTAMIMVKAMESKGTEDPLTTGEPADDTSHAGMEQSVTLTFMVEVK